MKKLKLFGMLLLTSIFIVGCSCSKINEDTYENAVKTFKETDALSFSRIEVVTNSNDENYTRKKIDAKIVFDAEKHVAGLEYSLVDSEGTSGGVSNVSKKRSYYYDVQRYTLYTKMVIRETQSEQYKQRSVHYEDIFNVDKCSDLDCTRMIVGNFAPIFNLNAVIDFEIEDSDGVGVARFKAVCPTYEHCASPSQLLDYTVTINGSGNIETLAYTIVNGINTYTINYTFNGYGSNNVKITFPTDLESYIEK